MYKRKMKELDDQIELEERQLHLLQERENGRTFQKMVARVEIGRVNFGASIDGISDARSADPATAACSYRLAASIPFSP